MNVTDRDIENVRRVAEDLFEDRGIDIVSVRDTKGDVMVEVEAAGNQEHITRNAFAGENLRKFHENGYVAVAVAGGGENHSAWFERADALEFGDPGPEDEYDLVDDWRVVVGMEKAVLKHKGGTVAHVTRDGWRLDEYVINKVVPAKVARALDDIGFEQADIE